jgi:hypothetical protein
VGYLVFYLWLLNAQGGTAAWWYVALLAVAALSLAAAAMGTLSAWQRPALTAGFAASALAMIIALMSIGIFLGPSVVASAVALVVRGRRQARSQDARINTSRGRR